jgi:hypothetical protein
MATWGERVRQVATWVDRSSWRRLAVLFALTVILRLASFTQSALDWDEGVYLLMARSLVHGIAPYTAVWDHKPPGIYFLFALVELVGGSVMAIRLLACLALAATAWSILSLWSTLLGGANRRGWIAALIFLGLVERYYPAAVNTEHFFVAFVALGFALLWPLAPGMTATAATPPPPRRAVRAFFGGLLLGVAFQIKFLAGVDIGFMLGLLVWAHLRADPAEPTEPRARPRWGELARIGGPLLLGLALPSLAVLEFFSVRGLLHQYASANFLANLHHADDRQSLRGTLDFLTTIVNAGPLPWALAAVAAPALYLARADRALRLRAVALTIWLILTLLAVLAPGQPYEHYAIQTALPGALLAAFALDALILSDLSRLPDPGPKVHRAAATVAVLLTVYGALVCTWAITALDVASRVAHRGRPHPDVAASVASYLRPRLRTEHLIYVVDWEPIVYELAGADWPTRYVFPPFLADPHFARVAGVDPREEVLSIKRQRPLYLVRRQEPEVRYAAFRRLDDQIFDPDYKVETVIGPVEILRRNGS